MTYASTVTSKYQVVIPKRIREAVKIKAGDTIVMHPMGDVIVMQSKRRKTGWADSLLGLGKEVWKGVDPVEYVREERAAWDE